MLITRTVIKIVTTVFVGFGNSPGENAAFIACGSSTGITFSSNCKGLWSAFGIVTVKLAGRLLITDMAMAEITTIEIKERRENANVNQLPVDALRLFPDWLAIIVQIAPAKTNKPEKLTKDPVKVGKKAKIATTNRAMA